MKDCAGRQEMTPAKDESADGNSGEGSREENSDRERADNFQYGAERALR